MKKNIKQQTKNLATSGLLLASGFLLVFLTSHAFGIPGTVMLPMHIPVLLTGVLCGPVYGAIMGVVLPILSSLLTGMPSFYPMLPIMLCELMVYGLVSGLVYKKFRKSVYPALLAAMLCGRAAYGLMFALLFALNGEMKALSVTAAFVTGLPGIAVQLVFIPLIVLAVNKLHRGNSIMKKLPNIALSDDVTCIVVQNGNVVYSASGNGVKPLLKLYDTQKELFSGAYVLDKIIGRAAASILVSAGAKKVYGEVMSETAIELLEQNGIEYGFDKKVDYIVNRAGDGMCPLEAAVSQAENVDEAIENIRKTVVLLMAQKTDKKGVKENG